MYKHTSLIIEKSVLTLQSYVFAELTSGKSGTTQN